MFLYKNVLRSKCWWVVGVLFVLFLPAYFVAIIAFFHTAKKQVQEGTFHPDMNTIAGRSWAEYAQKNWGYVPPQTSGQGAPWPPVYTAPRGNILDAPKEKTIPNALKAAPDPTAKRAKFCSGCGKELPEGSVFCPFCGRNQGQRNTEA